MRAALLRVGVYRQHAKNCLRFASETNDTEAKLTMLKMAQVWANLAEQAEKNSRLDLVYETPTFPKQGPAC
jgi:hypothetical protein